MKIHVIVCHPQISNAKFERRLPVAIICYETESGIFEFDYEDVIKKLNHYAEEEHFEEAIELLTIISKPISDKINIPEEFQFILHIISELIREEKGSVKCKICDKTYQPRDLRTISVGHGKNPFDIKLSQEKRGVTDIFKGKQKLPGMLGGKGYTCPESHELMSMMTWQT